MKGTKRRTTPFPVGSSSQVKIGKVFFSSNPQPPSLKSMMVSKYIVTCILDDDHDGSDDDYGHYLSGGLSSSRTHRTGLKSSCK